MDAPMLAALAATGVVAPALLAAGLTTVVRNQALAQPLTVAACALATAAALVLLGFARSGEVLSIGLGGWSPPLGIRWRIDGLSAPLLVVTSTIGLVVAIYAGRFFAAEGDAEPSERFRPLFLLLMASLGALFLSGDIFNLYVTLELAGLAAVTLVVLEKQPGVLEAGLRYLIVALASATTFLLGVALVYGAAGTLDLGLLRERLVANEATVLALALMTVGLMGKTALFPLHGWLPPAHGTAPPPASALLSGLVVTGSLYILLRLWLEVYAGIELSGALRQLVGGFGAAAVLWGGLHALRQRRLKLILAYSTVAQLGYLVLVVPLSAAEAPFAQAAWIGTGTLLLAHALAKGAMFLGVGLIAAAAGHDRMPAMHQAVRERPMTVMALAVAGLTLAGLPPSGGFAAKWLLLWASVGSGQWWWALVLLAGSLLAMGYTLRLLAPTMRAPKESALPGRPVPKLLEVLTLLLALLSLAIGFAGHDLMQLIGTSPASPAGGTA